MPWASQSRAPRLASNERAERIDDEDSGSDAGSYSSSSSASTLDDVTVLTDGRKVSSEKLYGNDSITLDDEDATYVLVFTRGNEPGTEGAVDCDELVEDPVEMAKRIFVRPEDVEEIGDMIDELGDEPVTAAEYHSLVRRKIEAVLMTSGLRCTSFPSVDGDETFLKIHLDREGEIAQTLAEHFGYEVPLSKACYSSTNKIVNKAGEMCFAQTPFSRDLYEQGKLQRLRRVDMIRLIQHQLRLLIRVRELREQNFITMSFPVAGFAEQKALKKHWTLPLHFRRQLLPEHVRMYFGEKIGFFFFYFVFYIRALFILGLFASLVFWVDIKHVHVDFWVKSYFKVGFSIAIVLWALLFELLLNRSISRAAQAWGMTSTTSKGVEGVLPSFQEEIVGTWRDTRGQLFAFLGTLTYCTIFVLIVEAVKSPAIGGGAKTKILIVSVLITVSKLIWGKVAVDLTLLENHKTRARFDDALIGRLFIFKLFFYIWPPMSIYLIDNVSMAYCGDTKQEAVEKYYGPLSLNGTAPGFPNWPCSEEVGMLNESSFEKLLSGYFLDEDAMSWRGTLGMHVTDSHDFCISYCLPKANCYRVPDDMYETYNVAVDAYSTCFVELKMQILTQFVVHVASSIVCLLIPFAQTYLEIRKEVSAANSNDRGSSDYSFLQIQAKCQQFAPYEYRSWGGSYVEDFLELVLAFAYVSAFGMVVPGMILIAAVAQVIEYGLLILRMQLITGRPYPAGADGIGNWKRAITITGTVAVVCNGFIAAWVMHGIWFRPLATRMLILLGFGSCSLFLRTMLRNTVNEVPHDTRRIDDYNQDVLKNLRPIEILQFPKAGEDSFIDIGLRSRERQVSKQRMLREEQGDD